MQIQELEKQQQLDQKAFGIFQLNELNQFSQMSEPQ